MEKGNKDEQGILVRDMVNVVQSADICKFVQIWLPWGCGSALKSKSFLGFLDWKEGISRVMITLLLCGRNSQLDSNLLANKSPSPEKLQCLTQNSHQSNSVMIASIFLPTDWAGWPRYGMMDATGKWNQSLQKKVTVSLGKRGTRKYHCNTTSTTVYSYLLERSHWRSLKIYRSGLRMDFLWVLIVSAHIQTMEKGTMHIPFLTLMNLPTICLKHSHWSRHSFLTRHMTAQYIKNLHTQEMTKSTAWSLSSMAFSFVLLHSLLCCFWV